MSASNGPPRWAAAGHSRAAVSAASSDGPSLALGLPADLLDTAGFVERLNNDCSTDIK